MSRRKRFVLIVTCVLLGASCLLPCVQRIRDGEGWYWSSQRLHAIGIALHNYHRDHGTLPPAVVKDEAGRPLYSWRVLLLPYLEDIRIVKQFHLDEPWDSPHNRTLADQTPPWYVTGHSMDPPGTTRYQAFVGPGTAFERAGLTWADFPDGLGNTILIAEARTPVVWSQPVDMKYAPEQPLPLLETGWTKPAEFLGCQIGRKPAGILVLMADGSTRMLPSDTNAMTLRALITRNGGEKVHGTGAD